MRERDKARSFRQDLMRGEHTVGGTPARGPWDAYNHDDEVSTKIIAAQPQSGTSIFDPVVCELVYRWFCPPNGMVLDPFAGGSVRGIVASKLGRRYLGIDLRPEQLEANREQASRICGEPKPEWVEGDARDISRLGMPADLIFTCPPYFDLERYSEDARDLSNMSWAQFQQIYRGVIGDCLALLHADRFACFVVGDIRDSKGSYRNLPGETIEAFMAAGCSLYNDAVLITAVGSLPIRVGKQFEGARKLGKTHQNVLVFIKGDPKRATAAIGPVECGEITDNGTQENQP